MDFTRIYTIGYCHTFVTLFIDVFSAAPHFLNLYNQGGQCNVNMTMGHIIKNSAMKPEFSLIWS